MSAQVERLVVRGRRKAESLMVDTCTIRPVTGETTDPNTGEVTTTYGDPVYTGKCKLQQQRLRYPETPSGGEHQWTLGVTEIHLPVTADAGNVTVGHVATIDSSFNPSNVGRTFRVQTPDKKTFQTAVRLITEEVLG